MAHIGALKPSDAKRARKRAAEVNKDAFRGRPRATPTPYSQVPKSCQCERRSDEWRDEDWTCYKCGKPIKHDFVA